MSEEELSTALASYEREYRRDGGTEAIENAIAFVMQHQVPLPPWLAAAVLRRIRTGETARERKARAQRNTDKLRALDVIALRHQTGCSLEKASWQVAERTSVSVEAINASVDRFLRNNRVKVVTAFGPEPPNRPRASRRIG
jgi:hypothetical protein